MSAAGTGLLQLRDVQCGSNPIAGMCGRPGYESKIGRLGHDLAQLIDSHEEQQERDDFQSINPHDQ